MEDKKPAFIIGMEMGEAGGKCVFDNPYPVGSRDRKNWLDGFVKGTEYRDDEGYKK